jgi:hypothetical protein
MLLMGCAGADSGNDGLSALEKRLQGMVVLNCEPAVISLGKSPEASGGWCNELDASVFEFTLPNCHERMASLVIEPCVLQPGARVDLIVGVMDYHWDKISVVTIRYKDAQGDEQLRSLAADETTPGMYTLNLMPFSAPKDFVDVTFQLWGEERWPEAYY